MADTNSTISLKIPNEISLDISNLSTNVMQYPSKFQLLLFQKLIDYKIHMEIEIHTMNRLNNHSKEQRKVGGLTKTSFKTYYRAVL